MPSSVMHRLNIKFYEDIRRRRLQHGRRVRVLAVLSELRHLIRACSGCGDPSGRVYRYLEELGRLYAQWLPTQAEPLLLRSGACVELDTGGFCGGHNPVVVVVDDSRRAQLAMRPTPFDADSATCPLFDSALYRRRKSGAGPAIADGVDPCRPSWVDYLVDDLPEADVHGLFRLVVRSRVPDRTHSRYRAAIEEALAFGMSRRGYALDPLEAMRVCAYMIRRYRPLPSTAVAVRDAEADEAAAAAVLERVLVLWRHAGRRCAEELRAGNADEQALAEIRFKRWNNVASEAVVWQARRGDGLPAAWALVGEWHGAWVQAMQALSAERRRGFADGEDAFASPFWRPKRPGRLRLHELTLSAKAVCSVLARLADAGLAAHAAELLGLATSEAGVPPAAPMFNAALRALAAAAGSRAQQGLPSLAGLPLANQRALGAYRAPGGSGSEMLALLRGMARWGIAPDRTTLGALVAVCCRGGQRRQLQAVLQAFAARWRVTPSPRCWAELDAHGLRDSAERWVEAALSGQPDPGGCASTDALPET